MVNVPPLARLGRTPSRAQRTARRWSLSRSCGPLLSNKGPEQADVHGGYAATENSHCRAAARRQHTDRAWRIGLEKRLHRRAGVGAASVHAAAAAPRRRPPPARGGKLNAKYGRIYVNAKYGRIYGLYVICCQDDMRRSVPRSEAHDATAAARYVNTICNYYTCIVD